MQKLVLEDSGLLWIVPPDRRRTLGRRLLHAGKRAGKVAAPLVLAGSISLSWVFRRPWFEGNLAVVDPDRVIRSAQPTSQLARWIQDFHLRSVLNLRGGSKSDWWYLSEVKTVQDHGVAFYDLPLAATRRPTRRELLFVIDILERCPYPLLIHCKSGADRTGLASALYLMVKQNQTPELAENAFSVEFGHIPFLGTEHLHEPLREYAAWLKDRDLPHSPERFRDWVKTEYQSPDPPVDPPLWPPGPREEVYKAASSRALAAGTFSKASNAREPVESFRGRSSTEP